MEDDNLPESFEMEDEDLMEDGLAMEGGELEDDELGMAEDDWGEDDYGTGEDEEFFPALAALIPKIAPFAINALSGLFKEDDEFEDDYEDYEDYEDDFEAGSRVPGLSAVDESVAELLAAEAAKTRSPAEGSALAAAAASRLLGKAPLPVKRKAPTIAKGAARVAKTLKRNRATNPLVKAVPAIVKRTVADLSKKARAGRPITNKTVAKTMAKQTSKVLKPRTVAAVVAKSDIKRKRLNRGAISRSERLR